ncbi:hypothetical protein [Sinorhizobium sp. RAC02]|uniref:hypothetical protein n=1 Tax=Sinorhizobium sp. RAC02 TaxID=1842534 RepID=UPI0012375E46|nr:hypothetical protein [Sinorhizobium sp. RAC02]
MGTARMGLDWYEPLLADAERHYGNDSEELSHLLGLMSAAEEKRGNMKQALAYGERSYALVDDRVDRGRRVSAFVTFAKLNHRVGKTRRSRQLLDEAVAFADANCSSATQSFARSEKLSLFPRHGLSLLFHRIRGMFRRV